MKRAQFAAALGAVAFVPVESPAKPATADAVIWSGEYWARKGTVKLAMYRKRLGAPATRAALPVLFLVHGSSMAGAQRST